MDLLWISMGSFCEMKKWASDSHRSRQVFSCWLDSQKTCFLECGGWIATPQVSFWVWWLESHEVLSGWAALLAGGDHAGMRPKENIANMQGKKRKHVPDPGDEMQLTSLWQSCCSTNFAGGESVPVKCSSMLLQQWWVVQADRTSTLWPNLEVVVLPSKIATGTWSGLSLVACLRHSQCRWPLWSELRMLRDLCWRKRKIYLKYCLRHGWIHCRTRTSCKNWHAARKLWRSSGWNRIGKQSPTAMLEIFLEESERKLDAGIWG